MYSPCARIRAQSCLTSGGESPIPRSLQCRATLAFIALFAAVSAGCTQPPPSEPAAPAAPALSQVERREKLIIGGGCHDCHTPKKIGPTGPEADLSLKLEIIPESDNHGAVQDSEGQPVDDSHQRSPDGVERRVGCFRTPPT